ncbi:hypothetical protein K491DRAFT_692507 [Lophiostoma macrostomum CBS 122681]|uniref:Uncharacterized protein n=1 Tax=Lophiostoma macrostomum CBS 122681 TaxID=1314788 RepID=A0A6A6T789_9PLEO|nr:hypothetical protein K491DRAFT_692507 [Lophiostoma macrostomum CBS 122681]
MSRAAASNSDYTCVDFLLRNVGGTYNATSLLVHLLLTHHHEDYCKRISFCRVQAVLEAGADVDGGDYIATPLQIATRRMDIDTIRWLLQAGADPNRTGRTRPLHLTPRHDWYTYEQLSGLSPLWLHRTTRVGRSPHEQHAVVDACFVQYGGKEISDASRDTRKSSSS